MPPLQETLQEDQSLHSPHPAKDRLGNDVQTRLFRIRTSTKSHYSKLIYFSCRFEANSGRKVDTKLCARSASWRKGLGGKGICYPLIEYVPKAAQTRLSLGSVQRASASAWTVSFSSTVQNTMYSAGTNSWPGRQRPAGTLPSPFNVTFTCLENDKNLKTFADRKGLVGNSTAVGKRLHLITQVANYSLIPRA